MIKNNPTIFEIVSVVRKRMDSYVKLPLFVLLGLLAGCSEEVLDSSLSDQIETLSKENSSNLKSSKSVKLSVSSASASATQNPNVPNNVIDGNMDSRWSGLGDPVNLDLDLGSTPLIDYIKIAYHKGNIRTNSFQVWVRASSSSSWEHINTKSSSGNTENFEEYDLQNRDARFLRLVCFGNSDSDWNSIDEIEVWGTPDGNNPPPPPGGGDTPGDVLGLTTNTWKLNGFTGSPGSNSTYEDDVLDAVNKNFSNYEDNNYFYTDGSWTYFKCYRGLGTSQNSDNPRVELRELSNGNLASWDGSGNNSMTWTVRVDQLPKSASGSNGILCFGQIHGPSNGTDDLIRLQFEGSANQSSGSVRLKISGYITEEFNGSEYQEGFSLDTEYTFKLQFSNGTVKVFKNGSQIFSRNTDTSTKDNYFKVGNYLQSSQGASFDGSYGIVRVKNLSISH